MLFPDYKEFSRLARTASLVPVAKTVAADLRTPVSAFLSVAADEPNAFLLESVVGGEKIGRYTFLVARPYMILRARGRQITIERISDRKDRVVEQVDFTDEVSKRPMKDGDLVSVLAILPRFDNAVSLRGNVATPLRFPYRQGMRVLWAHLQDEPPNPTGVSEQVGVAVKSALQKAPEDRPKTGTEYARKLSMAAGIPIPDVA